MCKLPIAKTYTLYFYVKVRYTNRKEMIKDNFGPMFEAMLQGEITVDVPRDRQSTFEPQVIPKRTRDIADTIEDIYGFVNPILLMPKIPVPLLLLILGFV